MLMIPCFLNIFIVLLEIFLYQSSNYVDAHDTYAV